MERYAWRSWHAVIPVITVIFLAGNINFDPPREALAGSNLDVCPSGCAYTEIQPAILDAEDGDTITVGAGTYIGPFDFLGRAITLKSAAGSAVTFLDGQGSGPVVRFATGEGRGSVLDGFTVRNGVAEKGGGVFISYASPTIRNCVVSGNSAVEGGGMYIEEGIAGESSEPLLQDCVISSNEAESAGGGVLYYRDNLATDGVTESLGLMDNCVVSDNAAGTYGGGIRFSGRFRLRVASTQVRNNRAGLSGGGISSTWGLELTGSVIEGNEATVDGGGCAGGFLIEDSIIRSNRAGRTGGGVNGFSVLRRSVIEDNEAESNGGIWGNAGGDGAKLYDSVLRRNRAELDYGAGSVWEARRCVIEENEAGRDVGGLRSAYIYYSTIAGNRAGRNGGGLWAGRIGGCLVTGNYADGAGGGVYTPAFMFNTTVAGNYASSAGGVLYAPPEYMNSRIVNSIIWGNANGDLSGNIPLTYSNVGTVSGGSGESVGNISVDPLFRAPKSSLLAPVTGGDYHIGDQSPCVDAGTLGYEDWYWFNYGDYLRLDLDGEKRPLGMNMDMGADEVDPGYLLTPWREIDHYSHDDQYAFEWTDISSTGTSVLRNEAMVRLPFPFQFYDKVYGWIGIEAQRGKANFNFYSGVEAGVMKAMSGKGLNGGAWYEVLGTEPDRRFVVQFRTRLSGIPLYANYQIVLFERDGRILYQYLDAGDYIAQWPGIAGGVNRQYHVLLQKDCTRWDIYAKWEERLRNNLAIMWTPEPPDPPPGPEIVDYSFKAVPFEFEDIRETGLKTEFSEEVWSHPISLPFEFPFYDRSHELLWAHVYGELVLSDRPNMSAPYCQPVCSYNTEPVIMPLGFTQYYPVPYDGSVYYEVRGEEPSRRAIVQWETPLDPEPSADTVTYQTVLFEENGEFLFSYKDMNQGEPVCVGLHKDGIEALLYCCTDGLSCVYDADLCCTDDGDNVIRSSTAIRWTPVQLLEEHDAGGAASFSGIVGGEDTFVGNIALLRLDSGEAVPLALTGGGGTNPVPKDGIDYEAVIEVSPANPDNTVTLRWSLDAYAGEDSVAMTRIGTGDGKDRFSAVLPNPLASPDTRMEFSFRADVALEGSSHAAVEVPGAEVRFYYDITTGDGGCFDTDGDGICADTDNCVNVSNSGQEDGDGDGLGDACDSCPAVPGEDGDGDGFCGAEDNCPFATNAGQEDSDSDGLGDACDSCPDDPGIDGDGDTLCGLNDPCPGSDLNDDDGDGFCAGYGFNPPKEGDGDCNVWDARFYPGAPELCEGYDTDCDGVIPEDELDLDLDGFMVCEGDCDDSSPWIVPNGEGVCIAYETDWNGDGKPDVLWRNLSTGANYVWYMDGAAVIGAAALPPVPDLSWRIAGSADFSGDGRPDVLWRNLSTGANYVWYMEGPSYTGGAPLPSAAPLWEVTAAADFDGDGDPDILWSNTAVPAHYIWQLDGTAVTGGVPLAMSEPEQRVAGGADFNGDGRTDILWRNAATGELSIGFMNGFTETGSTVLGAAADPDWQVGALADYDGDDDPDILWRNYETGANHLWFMDGAKPVNPSPVAPVADTDWCIED